MNPLQLLELQNLKNTFEQNHPKFPLFLKAASQKALREGSIIEIQVTSPEGETIASNLKVTASDVELIQKLLNLPRS